MLVIKKKSAGGILMNKKMIPAIKELKILLGEWGKWVTKT